MTGKMIISTDWHLKPSNIEEITELQRQELNVAEDNGITNHVWLGDIFDSRISQRQDVLNAFSSILDMYARMEHKIYCIPGNHDKSDYSSDESFLDAFKYHKGFKLITELDAFEIGGIICYFMPFFDNAIWLKEMDNDVLKEKNHKTHVLFTHIAFQGSRNNDGSEVESDIKPSLFKNFGMVFSGHYHDFQEIGKNIVHLGSITQNNFGEDDKKGFWLLDDDLTYAFIPSKGKRYRKVTVNLENTTFKQADKIVKDFQKKNKEDFIRVEFVGTKDAISSIDKEEYRKLGVDVKVKSVELETEEVETAEEIKALSGSDIADKFKGFCEQNDYSYNEGMEILKEVL